MEDALAEQGRSGAVDLHRGWIEGLLTEYYDPMYVFQREKKGARIEFAGERGAVIEYLRDGANTVTASIRSGKFPARYPALVCSYD